MGEETQALDTLFKDKISSIRSNAAANAVAARKDLTEKTGEMYAAMADAQRKQIAANEDSQTKINSYSATSLAAIKTAKDDFSNRLDNLADTVTANQAAVEH